MKHEFRFFGKPSKKGFWAIDDAEEIHHLAKVLRKKTGDFITLCDGEGCTAEGEITEISSKIVFVQISKEDQETKPSSLMTIALGALKAGDIDDILAPLTELGIDAFYVFAQKGTSKERMTEQAVMRWQRIISNAVKQSKRFWRPSLVVYSSLENLLREKGYLFSRTFALAQEGVLLKEEDLRPKHDVDTLLIIGSEKGFVEEEETLITSQNIQKVALGPHVLRSKTAAVAAASLFCWGHIPSTHGDIHRE